MRTRWKMAGMMVLGVGATLVAAAAHAQDDPADRAVSDILKILADQKLGKGDLEKIESIFGKVKNQVDQKPPPKPQNPADAPATSPPVMPAPVTPPTAPVAATPATSTTAVVGDVRDKLKANLAAADAAMVVSSKNSLGHDPDEKARASFLASYVDAPGRNKFVALYKSLTNKDKIDPIDRPEINKIIAEIVGGPVAPLADGATGGPAATDATKKKPPSNGTIFEEVVEVLEDAAEVAIAPGPADIESLVVDSGRLFGALGQRCAARRASRVYTTRSYTTRSVLVTRPSRSARYILVNP